VPPVPVEPPVLVEPPLPTAPPLPPVPPVLPLFPEIPPLPGFPPVLATEPPDAEASRPFVCGDDEQADAPKPPATNAIVTKHFCRSRSFRSRMSGLGSKGRQL